MNYVALKVSRVRYFVPTHTLLTRSFIAPSLTYGLVAWGQASKSSLDKLLKLQKRGLHFIYFSNCNEHAIPLFVDPNILPLTFSYWMNRFLTWCMMCNMEFHLGVCKLYLNTVSGMDQYNTRSSESQNFYINIPDCPFMLIIFQESELNCGINMEQPSSTQSSSKHQRDWKPS